MVSLDEAKAAFRAGPRTNNLRGLLALKRMPWRFSGLIMATGLPFRLIEAAKNGQCTASSAGGSKQRSNARPLRLSAMRGKYRIHTQAKRYQKFENSCCHLAAIGPQSDRGGVIMRVLGFAAIGSLIVAGCASKSSDIMPAYASPVRAYPLRGTSAGGSNGRSRNGRPLHRAR